MLMDDEEQNHATMKFNSQNLLRVEYIQERTRGTKETIKNSRNEKNTFLVMKAAKQGQVVGKIQNFEFNLARLECTKIEFHCRERERGSFLFRIIILTWKVHIQHQIRSDPYTHNSHFALESIKAFIE